MFVSKYVDQFRPTCHEFGLRTTCWFYAERTRVPHHNYRQNLNRMQREETGAKTFLFSSKMTMQYMLRKVPYAVSMPLGHGATVRREHALGARGHGVGHLVMVPTYGGKYLGSRKIFKIHLHKYTVSCNFSYSAPYEKNR